MSTSYWRILEDEFDWAAWIGDPAGQRLAFPMSQDRRDPDPATILDRSQNVWIVETVSGPNNDNYDDRFGPIVHLRGWLIDREGNNDDTEVELSLPLVKEWNS